MLFQIYNDNSKKIQIEFTNKEKLFENYLKKCFLPFPINRVCMKKNNSLNIKEIVLSIELDSILTSEILYNKIVYRIFKSLNVNLVALQNNNNFSNFSYFFYGKKIILNYECSIFIDVPRKAYLKN